MVVIVTAAGDRVRVLTAQLALLTTTTMAFGLDATLRILFPCTLQASGTIEPVTRILGYHFSFTGRSSHGSGAAFAFGIFTAQLTLLTTAAVTLAVEAAVHRLLFRVYAHLWGINGMVVIVTAAGDRVRILTAQLALLTTTAMAFGLDATLRILFPCTLQASGTIEPVTRILGYHFSFTGRSSHGSGAAFAFGIFTAQLTLLTTAALTLAVEAAVHRLLFRVYAHLWGINGMVVIVTAAGDRVRILTAQLALLTTTTMAFGLDATLRILFPCTLQASGTIEPVTRILGYHFSFTGRSSHGSGAAFAFGIFTAQLTLLTTAAVTLAVEAAVHRLLFRVYAHLWGINGMVVIVTAAGDRVRILTAQLALLTTTTMAFGLDATLRILFPCTLQASGTIEPVTGILGFGFADVDAFGSGAARTESVGIFSAKLTLFAPAALADGVHAR